MLKQDKKTLISNYKCKMKDLRIQSGISAKTMSIIFDYSLNKVKNFEHGLCNDIYLTMFYCNTYILRKEYCMEKRKDKLYIKSFILENIPEITSKDIENISIIYNIPESYVKLFYAVTEYIDEYILIILIDYFLMGGNKNASNK